MTEILSLEKSNKNTPLLITSWYEKLINWSWKQLSRGRRMEWEQKCKGLLYSPGNPVMVESMQSLSL